MGRKNELRTFRLEIEKEILEKVENTFCKVKVEDVVVNVRTLTSVCREAFLRGMLQMIEEQMALRKEFGFSLYLKESGIGFAEDVLLGREPDEEP